MVLDEADLAGIVIHKWEPTHGIYFQYPKILPIKSHAQCRYLAATGPPSPVEHQNLATDPYKPLNSHMSDFHLPEMWHHIHPVAYPRHKIIHCFLELSCEVEKRKTILILDKVFKFNFTRFTL